MAQTALSVAGAEFRRVMVWILVAAAIVFAVAIWYMSLFVEMSIPMIGGLGVGVFASVVLGCGLFAAAFFSNNSGLDQRVADAAHAPAPLQPNPAVLPEGLASQRRTMEFTAETLPAPLLKDHSTKAGTWALIRVLEGTLRYDIADDRRPPSSVVLTASGDAGIVEPTILHHISAIGPVRFYLEFLRDAGSLVSASSHHGLPTERRRS